MSSSESETEYQSPSTGGSKIRCFESSKDYPLWSKRIMNHLMGAGLESAIIPSDETKATTPSAKAIEKGERINRKAFTFIYARLHDNVLIELSPEVSNPAKPNAMALWQELGEKYGGGAMHELVSTIDVVLSTRVAEGEDPRDKLNDMRSAFLKLNANSIPLDDKFFALIILKALPETYAATIQVLFAQPDLSSTKVITSACNYWNMRTKTKEDESTVAFTARKNLNKSTNRNTGFVNSNSPGTFHCIYHPGANSHNIVDCRKAKQLAQSNGRNSQSSNGATANVATIEDVMSYATAYIVGQGRSGRKTEFYLDSGASGHLTCDKELLVNPVPYRSAVTIGDGSQLYSTPKGSIRVTDSIKVDNALYVPGLACNLLSVRELLSGPFKVRFDKDQAVILNETCQSVLGTAAFERHNGTYTLRASPSVPSAMLATSTDYVLNWHNRLGHLHFGEVVKLGKAGWLDKDWESKYTFANVNSDEYICEPCILGKGARQASHRTDERRKGHVHTDLWGPARTPTINGARYMLTCYDDYSRRTQVFFLKKKSDALAAFADYIKLVENHCQTTIKTVRSDNGGEFTSARFAALLARNGIEPMPIPADAHAQNGRVERQHLTIFNTVRTLLIHLGLPDRFWGEAASYAVHLRNHLPLSNSSATPMSMWTGKPSRPLSSFQPFGSTVYVRDHTQTNKLKPRYLKATLLGWRPLSASSVKFWHRETNFFGYSRDVVHGLPVKSNNETSNLNQSVIPAQESVREIAPSLENQVRNDSTIANNSGDHPEHSPVQSPRYQQSELEEDDVDAHLSGSPEERTPEPALPPASTKSVKPFTKAKPKDRKGISYEIVAVDEDRPILITS